ncbi:MAG: hypothetical protein ABJH06_15655 [Paraglaciecola sp.]|uniref:hypothetical protein n=1 Tax=Paraglaciecola sp. TaxID=1920173 RepID=UPI00329784B6
MKLSTNTSLEQFENNYWYAVDLKIFAKEIGVKTTNKLRKDQLEIIIKHFLSTGLFIEAKVESRKNVKDKDYESSNLAMETVVKNYCSNKITKTFILTEAKKIQPDLPKKSGVWYWINRWREEQLEKNSITYGDIVHQFMELSNKKERLPRIPSTKFNNFIADFLAANKGERSDAIIAWEQLKTMNIPKTFEAWNTYNV